VLGFAVTHEDEALLGFETGAIKLYVEAGQAQGPVFEFLVPPTSPPPNRNCSPKAAR
jgi:hypothetical protein